MKAYRTGHRVAEANNERSVGFLQKNLLTVGFSYESNDGPLVPCDPKIQFELDQGLIGD